MVCVPLPEQVAAGVVGCVVIVGNPFTVTSTGVVVKLVPKQLASLFVTVQ